jgi:phosphoribosylformylglycinamidine synthase
MVKAYVVYGLGIGCHKEVAHAFEKAGAEAEIVHIKQLLSGEKKLSDSQILNLSGGFLHGDILGASMCAANELEHATIITEDGEKRIKDQMLEYAEKGNIVYGQCNGFQLLVKIGLLPGIDNDYSQQTVTLTHNDCGVYRVDYVLHGVEREHFAFVGLQDSSYLWCRHGEGKIQFYSDSGLISKDQGEENRRKVNERHVLLRYINPNTDMPTEEFPYNPNGSVDGIAGLVNSTGHIFGHMAHPEVSVHVSRNPRWFFSKEKLRRIGIEAERLGPNGIDALEDVGLSIFKNIVEYVK